MTRRSLAAFPEPIILASSSPRRRALLSAHGYRFESIVADIEEVSPKYLTAAEMTLLNAKAKAEAVAKLRPREIVVGADTLVALDGEPLGKPGDREEALAMLQRLCGRRHEVFTGVWIVGRGQHSSGFIEASRVHFYPLTAAQIRAYHSRIDPLDKAGAYAAQDEGGELIDRIQGSTTNVVGLPMEALARALRPYARS